MLPDTENLPYSQASQGSDGRATEFNLSKCASRSDRPQLAYDVYLRLLAIAEKYNPNGAYQKKSEDIRLAAYTGYGLYYKDTTATYATANSSGHRHRHSDRQ